MAHRNIYRLTQAAANILSWLFVFAYLANTHDVRYAFSVTVALYALTQLVIAVFTPFSARLLRHGVRRLLMNAMLAGATAYFVLTAALAELLPNPLYGFIAFAILLGVQRALYWLPYESEKAEVGGGRSSWFEIILIFTLLAAGLAVTQWPYAGPIWLIASAGALVAVSALPLVGLPDTAERYIWKHRKIYFSFISAEHSALMNRSALEGVFGGALLLLWPLAVFTILQSYAVLSVVFAVIFFVAIFFRSPIRRFLRHIASASPYLGIAVVVAPWLMRLAVSGPLGVIVVDSFFYTTTPKKLGIDPVVFDQTADAGYYVDEFSVLKEVGLAFGRFGIALIAAGAAYLLSVPAALLITFVLAGIISIRVAR